MNASDLQQLPDGLSLGLVVTLAAFYFALLSSRRNRRTAFTVLLTCGFAVLGAGTYALSYVPLGPARVDVLAVLVGDLILTLLISYVCLAQAGRLPRIARTNKTEPPLAEVVGNPRLRSLLSSAPWALLGASFAYGALLMTWPVPIGSILLTAGRMPPHVLVATSVSCAAQAFYAALAAWLFYRAATSDAKALTRMLRAKNLSFSAGVATWLILILAAWALAASLVLLPEAARRTALTLYLIAERTLTVTGLALFVVGLSLRYVAPARGFVVGKIIPAMRLQDRLETRKWHHLLGAGDRQRKLAAASHYALETADILGLNEEERTLALNTLHVATVLTDGRASAGPSTQSLTPEMARRLRDLQANILREEDLASKLRWPAHAGGGGSAPDAEHSVASLHVAVSAALDLVAPGAQEEEDDDEPAAEQRYEDSLWYGLAAAAATDVGLPLEAPPHRSRRNLSYARAGRAYQSAKESAKQTAAG